MKISDLMKEDAMKKILKVLSVVLVMIYFGGFVYAQVNFTEVGQWGAGTYNDVSVNGNYAYYASGTGLEVIDISTPGSPAKIAHLDTADGASLVFVSGNYAYVINGDGDLDIINISTPSSPTLEGTFNTSEVNSLYVDGTHVYLTRDNMDFDVVDVSTPSAPVLSYSYPSPGDIPLDVVVRGDYAYVAYGDGGLEILDIAGTPTPVGTCITTNDAVKVVIEGNYAYVLCGGLDVIDISNVNSPTLLYHEGFSWGSGFTGITDMTADEDYIYVLGWGQVISSATSHYYDYLQIVDIQDPLSITEAGGVHLKNNAAYPYGKAITVNGNYTYIANGHRGMLSCNVTDPANPAVAGSFNNSMYSNSIYLSGNHAFLGDTYNGVWAVNVNSPASPSLTGSYDTEVLNDITIRGNYLYFLRYRQSGHFYYVYQETLDISNPASLSLTDSAVYGGSTPGQIVTSNSYLLFTYEYSFGGSYWGKMGVNDIGTPETPAVLGSYEIANEDLHGIAVNGDYVYAAAGSNGLKVIDISTPSSPTFAGSAATSGEALNVVVSGNYAYVVCGDDGLEIFNITTPTAPAPAGSYNFPGYARNVVVSGDYAYIAAGTSGVRAINIANPASPYGAGSYNTPGSAMDVRVSGDYVYVADGEYGLVILETSISNNPPVIALNRNRLFFGADTSGTVSAAQTFFISNSGGGTLNWTANASETWLSCSPASGTGSGEVSVSVDASGLAVGTYTGTVTVADSNASNTPQTVNITLDVYSPGSTLPPLGDFATPISGSVVSSSIAVTGWVLDDVGVESVKIYSSDTYIGDAVFVEGARPDIETSYPGYPFNYQAGWGYMLLTNFLPGGGNGTYYLVAAAADTEGNEVILGTKTIIVDNANAVKPFGAIDIPSQGGSASGSAYQNKGWALTPMPNKIPEDGSTIRLYIDGVLLSNPALYNIYRSDIAGYFPGYANSDGAAAVFTIDTTAFSNGVHTIHWIAEDDAGNSDGIGSRYFSIQNSAGRGKPSWLPGSDSRLPGPGRTSLPDGMPDISNIPVDYSSPVGVIKGYNREGEPVEFYPNDDGITTMEIKELERIEIRLFPVGTGWGPRLAPLHSRFHGYQIVGNQLRPLPIGSTLDTERGIFYWYPGPGFVGSYRFIFLEDNQGNITRKDVLVRIQ
jgi:hypothetical protein